MKIKLTKCLHFCFFRLLCCLAVFGLTSSSEGGTTPPERDSAALLTIGNSFADNATEYLPALAKVGGKTLVLFRANIGGSSLSRHADHLQSAETNPMDPKGHPYEKQIHPVTGQIQNFSLPEALQAYRWDFVTVQQVSHQSFRPESYHPYIDQLVTAIRQYAPQAEILIHETWAYRADHPLFQQEPGLDAAKMYALLQSTYTQLAVETGFRILPVGDAFDAARQTERWRWQPDQDFDYQHPLAGQLPDQTKSLNVGWDWKQDTQTGALALQLDASHANVAGKYLGAVVFYEMLFGAKDAPADFLPPGLGARDAAALREIATRCVENERARHP